MRCCPFTGFQTWTTPYTLSSIPQSKPLVPPVVGGVYKLHLMHRVSYSQGEKASPMSPRDLALNMDLDLQHSQELPGTSSSSFCLHLTLSPSLSWILFLLFYNWFCLNSHSSNSALISSSYDCFTFCSFHYLPGFSQSFLRKLKNGKTPHFIRYREYLEYTSEVLFTEAHLIYVLDEATEMTLRVRSTMVRAPS